MAGFDSLRSVAKLLMVCLALSAVTQLVELGLLISQYSLLERAAEGLVDQAEAEASDNRIAVAAGVHVAIFLLNAVLFVIWMARAHRNLRVFGVPSPYSPRQVGWAFFIPILNLFRPYKIIRVIWEGSVPVDEKLIGRSTQIVSIWWACWVAGNLLGRASGSMGKQGGSIPSLLTATSFGIVSSLVFAAAAVLAVMVVQALTERQESCASGQVAEEFD